MPSEDWFVDEKNRLKRRVRELEAGVCTCKNGPVRTVYDPACPFHGDDGTMVATIRTTARVVYDLAVAPGAPWAATEATKYESVKDELEAAVSDLLSDEDGLTSE